MKELFRKKYMRRLHDLLKNHGKILRENKLKE